MDSYKLMKAAFIGVTGIGLFAACTGSGIINEVTPHLPDEVQTAVHRFRYGLGRISSYIGNNKEDINLLDTLYSLGEPTAPIGKWGRDIGQEFFGIDSDTTDIDKILYELQDMTAPLVEFGQGIADRTGLWDKTRIKGIDQIIDALD